MKKVIISLVIILTLIVIGGWYLLRPMSVTCWPYCPGMTDQDREQIKQSALGLDPADWQLYKDFKYGFEFSYPKSLTLNTVDSGFSLTHSVLFRHPDPCNLKDYTSLNSLTDFSLKGEIKNSDVVSILRSEKYYGINFDSTTNKPIAGDNNLREIRAGDLSGYLFSMGVEGCGLDIYYLSLKDNTTLIISNPWVGEFASVNGYKGQYGDLIGIILPDRRNAYLDQILSSFKFIN